jgi:hypothetical protein
LECIGGGEWRRGLEEGGEEREGGARRAEGGGLGVEQL